MRHSKQLRVALAVPSLREDRVANLAMIEGLTQEATLALVDLIVFPETTLTGFVHREDPKVDRRLAVAINGPEVHRLAALAQRCTISLAVGLLERDDRRLYDTALLFTADGALALTYRRISPQWHSRHADPRVYCQGTELQTASTAFGTVAFLICGDIMDDELLDRVRERKPDWLLLPIARGFDSVVHSEREWEDAEVPMYGQRVARVGIPTLLVNYVGMMDGFYGGAVAFRADGSVIASQPLFQPGLLIVDLLSANERASVDDTAQKGRGIG